MGVVSFNFVLSLNLLKYLFSHGMQVVMEQGRRAWCGVILSCVVSVTGS